MTGATLKDALEAAKQRYVHKNKISESLHQEATRSLPGGNTRTVIHANPFPLYMKSGDGYQLTSEDGRTYTDFTCEFTAALYGHSRPELRDAITNVLQNVGMNVGATTRQEAVFAQELCQRFDLERVRFANSGTEANLHALAAARLFTKKRKVVAFGGGYHGGVLGFAGGKPAVNNVDTEDWIVARYNDLESAREAIQSEGVAAVLLEGMQGAGGCIPARVEFLKGIQEAAQQAGVLFILDEVMTSRMSAGGLAHMHGLKPDLKTYGKWLGGGLAFGAFGGRADVMAAFDPRLGGSISHSGTFNNNTLVTHAGHVGLTKLYTSNEAERFTAMGVRFMETLNEVTKGTKMCFTGMGTVMALHTPKNGSREILRGGEVEEDAELKELFWFEMLEKGFWMAPAGRGLMALVWGTPEAELKRFAEATKGFLAEFSGHVAIE